MQHPVPEKSILKLLKELDDPSLNVASSAYTSLRELGVTVLPSLVACLEALPDETPSRAVEGLLAGIGGPAVLTVISLLKHPRATVRTRAIRILRSVGDSRAVSQLIPLLRDENIVVRIWTAIALRDIGDPSAVTPLRQALYFEGALAPSLDPESVPETFDEALVRTVLGALKYRRSRRSLSYPVIAALVRLGDTQVTAIVLAATSHQDRDIRVSAAVALGNAHGSKPVLQALMLTLGDSDWEVREATAHSLGSLAARKHLDDVNDIVCNALVSALSDESIRVVTAVIGALRDLNDLRAVPALKHVVENYEPVAYDHDSVRELASLAIQELQGTLAVDEGLPGAFPDMVADRLIAEFKRQNDLHK